MAFSPSRKGASMAVPEGFGPIEITKPRINPRTKGANGEREAIAILKNMMVRVEQRLRDEGLHIFAASDEVMRNALQSFKGGFDVHGLPIIALEIKRDNHTPLDKMWEQAKRQAVKGELPVLMWRLDRRPWNIRTIVALTAVAGHPLRYCHADITLADFLLYYEALYETHLRSMT